MNGGEKMHADILSEQRRGMPGPQGREKVNAFPTKVVSERISACILSKVKKSQGSLTIEAALVLPIFWYFFAGFIYILIFFRLQEDVSQVLADTGRRMSQAVYEDKQETEITETLAAAGLSAAAIKKELNETCDDAAKHLIKGGTSGIKITVNSLLDKNSLIIITARYQVKSPWILLNKNHISVVQIQESRAWIGYTGEEGHGSEEKIVYITPYGDVYHNDLECKYLTPSIQMLLAKQMETARNKDGMIYHPCETCSEISAESQIVYVTDYGNHYHTTLDCGGLKRTVFLVIKSEVEGKRPCAACGEKE